LSALIGSMLGDSSPRNSHLAASSLMPPGCGRATEGTVNGASTRTGGAAPDGACPPVLRDGVSRTGSSRGRRPSVGCRCRATAWAENLAPPARARRLVRARSLRASGAGSNPRSSLIPDKPPAQSCPDSSRQVIGLREEAASVPMLEIEQLVQLPVKVVSEPGHLRVQLMRRWPRHFPCGPSRISLRSTSNSSSQCGHAITPTASPLVFNRS